MCRVFTAFVSICLLYPLVSSQSYIDNETDAKIRPQDIEYDDFLFRVVNGKPATVGEIPNQISLKAYIRRGVYQSFCGGTIIAVNKIITAGHCVTEHKNVCEKMCGIYQMKNFARIYAVAGNLRNMANYVPDSSTTTEQWRRIERAVVPRGYKFPKRDISLVYTTKPFIFNRYVDAVPLASRDIDYGSIYCKASGFGRTGSGSASPILMWAYLRLQSKLQCAFLHRKNMRAFICTASDYTNVLQGDSGGPLMCTKTGDPADQGKGIIVGIVSGARTSKWGRYKTFFTRVSRYREFIDRGACPRNFSDLHVIRLLVIITFMIQ